jgi:hypothetical protein
VKINVKEWIVEIAAVILNLVLGIIVLVLNHTSNLVSEDTEFLVIATTATFTILLLIIKNDITKQVLKLKRQTGQLVTVFDPLSNTVQSKIVQFWEGQWKANWLIQTENGFVPYVDDGLAINDISPEMGMIEGTGQSAYSEEGVYNIRGRMISSRIAVLTYKTPFLPLKQLEGVAMLRMDKMGGIEGWWMSNTRDISGQIVLERAEDDEAIEYQVHHQ